jgi:hypothetical protein
MGMVLGGRQYNQRRRKARQRYAGKEVEKYIRVKKRIVRIKRKS